ncbi:MAG: ComEA family DNA-binding protein, partial [Candidatus Omnitrophota bacterium]
KVLILIGALILGGSLLRFFNVSLKEPYSQKIIVPASAVNINTATQSQLENLPGVGAIIARRIIEYRTQYGKFNALEDLKKVKGIGEKKLEILKAHVQF